MNKSLAIGIVLLILAIVTATLGLFLFSYQSDQSPQTDDTDSTQRGIQELVNANNKFAFELYLELDKNENGNIFYSPYSLSSALAMTYEGAKGQTADEMKSVFHFPETNTLRTNFAAIYNNINKKDKPYELRTGNALWAQQDYSFLKEYTDKVEKYYGGKVENLDFIRKTEISRQMINTFIEEQTNNKIKDLIPQGALTPLIRLVLTNAIYFKGTWTWEFDKSDTHDQDFKITSANIIKTPMMFMDNDKAKFNYLDLGDLQILELPYKGEEISMLIVLPTENLEAIRSSLTAENFEEWKSQLREDKLDAIYLPKFEFNTKYFMNDALSARGMPTAFSNSADFSGMTGEKNLFISLVIHQAYIKVDEEGTEAAAATAVGVGLTSASVSPRREFKVDHPFIFIIQEKETGNILFIGRVTDPTK